MRPGNLASVSNSITRHNISSMPSTHVTSRTTKTEAVPPHTEGTKSWKMKILDCIGEHIYAVGEVEKKRADSPSFSISSCLRPLQDYEHKIDEMMWRAKGEREL
ncbi:hypothetical protein JX265_007963 [Neoarthrinium moseri]|uniref:Uncharacterized protein n=1 Tax=Neoarthrinium moseri TaxID=1658444 RepID=A0A9P9WIS8_9PEZI|nr:hypothetical protein JX265_007963 [Neoarthrinium moseri]